MKEFLFVFAGSGIGGVIRYYISKAMQNVSVSSGFPAGTFTVNILACFMIGVFFGMIHERQVISVTYRNLLLAGFCGGFSTFSAFSFETITLWQSGHITQSILYVVLSVLIGAGATLAGIALVK